MNNQKSNVTSSKSEISLKRVEIPTTNMPSAAPEQHPKSKCFIVNDDMCSESNLSTPKSKMSSKTAKQPSLKMSASNPGHAQISRCVEIGDGEKDKSNLHTSKSESSCNIHKSSANPKEVPTKNGFVKRKELNHSISKCEYVCSTNSSSAITGNEKTPKSVCFAANDKQRNITNLVQKSDKCTINLPSDDIDTVLGSNCIAVNGDNRENSNSNTPYSTNIPYAVTENPLDQWRNGDTQNAMIEFPQRFVTLCCMNVASDTVELPLPCSGFVDNNRNISPSSVLKNEIMCSPLSDDSSIKSHHSSSKSRRSRKRAQQSNMKTFPTHPEVSRASSGSSATSDNKKEKSNLHVSKSESSCSTNKSSSNPKDALTRNSSSKRDVSNLCTSKSEMSCSTSLSSSTNNEKSQTNVLFAATENKRGNSHLIPKGKLPCSTVSADASVKLPSNNCLAVNDNKREKSNCPSKNKLSSSTHLPSADPTKTPTSSNFEVNGDKRVKREEENLYIPKGNSPCCKNVSSTNIELLPVSRCSAGNNKRERPQMCVSTTEISGCNYTSSPNTENVSRSICIALNDGINDKTNLNILEKQMFYKSTNMPTTITETARRSKSSTASNDKREKSNLSNSKRDSSCKTTVELTENRSSANTEQVPTSRSFTPNQNANGERSRLVISKSGILCQLGAESSAKEPPSNNETTLANTRSIINDKTKEPSNITTSKSGSSCKTVDKSKTNPSRIKTPQLKVNHSKPEHCQGHRSHISVLETETLGDNKKSTTSYNIEQNLTLKCTDVKNGGRKKLKLHRSKSVGASMKEEEVRDADKSSSEQEGTNSQREKKKIRHRRKVSKCSSLSKLKVTGKETPESRRISPTVNELGTKEGLSENTTRENESIRTACSQFERCRPIQNEGINEHKRNVKDPNQINDIASAGVNVGTRENADVIARPLLHIDTASEYTYKTDIIAKTDSTNTQDANSKLVSSNTRNNQEVEIQNLSTKRGHRRRKRDSTERQQKENFPKGTNTVSSTLDLSAMPTDTNEDQKSTSADRKRPTRVRKQTSRRTSPTKNEEVKDASNALNIDERGFISDDNGSNASTSKEGCSSSTTTPTSSKSFLRILFTSIARFFGRKEIKSKADNTSKTETAAASMSKGGDTLPGASATNADEKKKRKDVSTRDKNGKQQQEENMPPFSVTSKDKRKQKSGLKSILKKKPSSPEICNQTTQNSNGEVPSLAMRDQKGFVTDHRETASLSSTTETCTNTNVSKSAIDKKSVTAFSRFSTVSSNSSTPSARLSSDTLGQVSLTAPVWKQHQPSFKRYRSYHLGCCTGRFKSVLSTVNESEEFLFRRHSEEDLASLRKMSEEERSCLESNLSEGDEEDAQEVNKKLRLMLRHKGIRVENLRAVLRLREKLLCRNADEIQNLKKQLLIAEMRIQRLCEMFLNLKKAHSEQVTRARELEVELRDVTNAVKALPTSTGKKKPTAAEKLIEEVKKNARLMEENTRLKKYLASLTNDKDVPFEAFNFD